MRHTVYRAFKPVKLPAGPALLWLCLLALLALPGRRAAAQDALARLRQRGTLAIGTDATYPPFEFIENGKLQGFDIDIGDEVGRELGVKVQWIPLEWAGVFPGLETGKSDVVMSGVTITAERKKGNCFSRPYFLSGQTLAHRRDDSTVRTHQDLHGKIVAVQQETTGQVAAEKLGLPKDQIHRFDTLQDGLTDVVNRKSSAAIGDLPALREILRKSYSELELTGGIFVKENLGIVARRNEPELAAAVNAALERILVDGRYARIYERWMGEPLTSETLGGLEAVRKEGTDVSAAAAARPGGAGGTSSAAASTGSSTAPAGAALALRWDLLGQALPTLLNGAKLTVLLTACTLLLSIPTGLLVALARLSSVAPVRAVAATYVEAVRGTPLLMQIYVIYFVLPAAGISLSSLAAGIVALTLNAAAYVSEIFRAGIQSIDPGQMEAARALGMDYPAAMRWVILPQTLRRVLPPLTNEAVALLKDSSLVSVVALSELMRAGKELATNAGSPMTIYLAVALLYLALTLPLTSLVRRLEMAWQPMRRTTGGRTKVEGDGSGPGTGEQERRGEGLKV
jgi:His/Glu/Gln/Arg/opine family amino acid ABC transporter permease subunit